MHMVRGLDARRGEIEDGGDARVHQVLGRTLGAFGRRGDDADLDVLLGHHGLEVLGAVHFQAVDDLTDLEGVAVEDAHDVEAAGAEFTVVQDGFAQVADAHERHAPFTVDPQGGGDGRNEGGYVIAHAADAEFAEVSQVLADLGAVDPAGFGQGGGGDDFNAVARKIFQHLHIGGQALDRGAGDVFAFGFRGHNQYLLKLVMLL